MPTGLFLSDKISLRYRLTLPMVRRLFWVCLPSLLTQVSFASDNAWNCQQAKNSKEWVCLGDKNPETVHEDVKFPKALPAAKNTESTAIAPRIEVKQVDMGDKAPTKLVTPIKVEGRPLPIEKTEPDIAQPLATESIDKTQSVITKPAENKLPEPVATVKEVPSDVVNKELTAPIPSSVEPVQNEPAPDAKLVQDMPPPSTDKADAAETKKLTDTETPGWHCGGDTDKDNWDCKLVGNDPKGKPKVVKTADQDYSMRLLDPVFDSQQEAIFSTLNARFPVDPWAGCSIDTTPQQKISPGKKSREESPMDMDSNYSEMFDNQIGNYEGDVEIRRADQRASSHSAHYDTVSETLNLQGDVFYSEDEIAIHTDTATLKLATDEAKLRDTVFISPTTPIRGSAKTVYRDNPFLSRYRDVAYTSCRPGNQDWAVHATELKMNKNTGKGAAKNAWLEFKGLPVFYSPYLSFPLDDRRQSGFLAPVFGNTRSSGFDFSTPFYWNIAPNYDATLRPRYLTERGVLLAGDFRYLTGNSQGKLSAEFLPSDTKVAGTDTVNKKDGLNSNYQNSRYQFSFDNITQFTPKISSNVDLNYVSDKNYFSELGNSLSFSNFKTIKSSADLKYIDDGIALTGQVVNYQRLDESLTGLSIPYRKLPQINLALDHAFDGLKVPLYTELDSEFVYFQHDINDVTKDVTTSVPVLGADGKPVIGLNGKPVTQSMTTQVTTQVILPEGQRLNIKPSVSLPWKTDSAYITPKASLQYTQYLLDNQGANSSNVSRVLPIISLDSGLYLERNLNIAGTTLLHTLEPRLFYLYIPKTDQRDIPLFDSSISDVNYNSLFRENRFNGTDRVMDANQITLALTSRLIDPITGREKLKLNLGNILYFSDRDVTLNYFDRDHIERTRGRAETTEFLHQRFSNVVAEVSSQVNEHFGMDTGLQWNPRTNHIERGNIGLHFVNNPGELVNLGFQFRRNESQDRTAKPPAQCDTDPVFAANNSSTCELIEKKDIIMSDATFRWPLYNDWYGIGRWQYSWLYGRTQEAFLGFEKENCCWRFRIIGRRYFNGLTNSAAASGTSKFDLNTAQAQTGVFFQIELKGLTGIGEKLDNFFEQNIYGYQKPEK
jgi:LPS-assembly protein